MHMTTGRSFHCIFVILVPTVVLTLFDELESCGKIHTVFTERSIFDCV